MTDLATWLGDIKCGGLLEPLDAKHGTEDVEDLLDLEPEHIDELCKLLKTTPAKKFRRAMEALAARAARVLAPAHGHYRAAQRLPSLYHPAAPPRPLRGEWHGAHTTTELSQAPARSIRPTSSRQSSALLASSAVSGSTAPRQTHGNGSRRDRGSLGSRRASSTVLNDISYGKYYDTEVREEVRSRARSFISQHRGGQTNLGKLADINSAHMCMFMKDKIYDCFAGQSSVSLPSLARKLDAYLSHNGFERPAVAAAAASAPGTQKEAASDTMVNNANTVSQPDLPAATDPAQATMHRQAAQQQQRLRDQDGDGGADYRSSEWEMDVDAQPRIGEDTAPGTTETPAAAPPSVLAPSPDTALAAPAAPAAAPAAPVHPPRKRRHRDSEQARRLGWTSKSRRRKKPKQAAGGASPTRHASRTFTGGGPTVGSKIPAVATRPQRGREGAAAEARPSLNELNLAERKPLDPSHRILKHMQLFAPDRNTGRHVPPGAAERVPFCLYENIANLAAQDPIQGQGSAAHELAVNAVGTALELQVVKFNSGEAGLSDARRDRLYWTNIPLPTAEATTHLTVRPTGEVCDTLRRQKYRHDSDDRKVLNCLTTGLDADKLNALNKLLSEQNRNGRAPHANLTKDQWKIVRRSNLIFESAFRIRLLTTLEREAIMGFPPGWLGSTVTDNEATKMLGNSWHIPTVETLLSGLESEIRRAITGAWPYNRPCAHQYVEDKLGTAENPLVVLSLFDGIGAGYCALNNCLARWNLDQDGLYLIYVAVEDDDKCQQVMCHHMDPARIVKHKQESAAADTTPPWMINGHRRNHRLLNGQSGGEQRDMWGDIKSVEKAIVAHGKHRLLLQHTFLVFNGFPCTDVTGNKRKGRQTSNKAGQAGEQTGLLRQAENIIEKVMEWKGSHVSREEEEDSELDVEGETHGQGEYVNKQLAAKTSSSAAAAATAAAMAANEAAATAAEAEAEAERSRAEEPGSHGQRHQHQLAELDTSDANLRHQRWCWRTTKASLN